MKLGLGLTVISVFTLGSTKKCEKTEEQIIESNNPYSIVTEITGWQRRLTYQNREFVINTNKDSYVDLTRTNIIYGDFIDKAIRSINSFEHISNNETKSKKSFTYNLSRSIMMWGYDARELTFYSDGFVAVKDNSYKNTFYFQFDAEKAAALFAKVEDTYVKDIEKEQEVEAIENEYNSVVDSFTIQDALAVLEQTDSKMSLKLSYYKTRPDLQKVQFDFEDDNGEFLNMFKSAKYRLSTTITYGDSGYDTSVYLETKFNVDKNDYWTLTFDETMGVTRLYRFKTDTKYERTFYTKKVYSIDEESLKSIMDKAFEILESQPDFEEGADED